MGWNFFITGMKGFFEEHSVALGSSFILAWRNPETKTGLVVACSAPSIKVEDGAGPPPAKAPVKGYVAAAAAELAPSTLAGKKPAGSKASKRGRATGNACIDLADEDDDVDGEARPAVAAKRRACTGGGRVIKPECETKDRKAAGGPSGKQGGGGDVHSMHGDATVKSMRESRAAQRQIAIMRMHACACLLYTSPSPRDRQKSRMPSSA